MTATTAVLRDLAVLLEAGLPAVTAFERAGGARLPHGDRALRRLRAGRALSPVLAGTGIATPAEGARLAAAEKGGLMPAALRRLADGLAYRGARRRALTDRMLLSLAVLLIALSATTVLGTVRDDVELYGLLAKNLAMSVGVVAGVGGLIWLVTRDAWWWWEQAWRLGLQDLEMAQQAFEATWLELLLWQLTAGRDAAAAIGAMKGLARVPAYERAIAGALRQVRNGRDLASALGDAGLAGRPGTQAVLHSAERSGRLGELGLHHTGLAGDGLSRLVAQVDAWLPRLVYVFTVVAALAMFPPL